MKKTLAALTFLSARYASKEGKHLLPARMTKKEKILQLLRDGKWHSTVELNQICFRYGARLHELKKEGYFFEKKKAPWNRNIELWRLVLEPRDYKTELKRQEPEEYGVPVPILQKTLF